MKNPSLIAIFIFFLSLCLFEQSYAMYSLSYAINSLVKKCNKLRFLTLNPTQRCWKAIEKDDVKALEQLMQQGTDVKKLCDDNCLLFLVVFCKARKVLPLLLKIGCNVNKFCKNKKLLSYIKCNLKLDKQDKNLDLRCKNLFDWAWDCDETRALPALVMVASKKPLQFNPGSDYCASLIDQVIEIVDTIKGGFYADRNLLISSSSSSCLSCDVISLIIAYVARDRNVVKQGYYEIVHDGDDEAVVHSYLIDHARDRFDDISALLERLKNIKIVCIAS